MLYRRSFLAAGMAALASKRVNATLVGSIPIGINTYCLRALKWKDIQLIDYADSLKMDAVFLQDSLDPEAMEPAHWRKVRDYVAEKRLHIETGTGAVLPRSDSDFDASVRNLRQAVKRAKAIGSPIVRCLHAADREHLPSGPVEQHIETMIKLLRSVRSEAMDAGLKFAVENHKDLLAWEMRQVIEGAGKEFVGSYLDTGNPVFVMEDPMTTLEHLGPLAVTVHLRDSVIYDTPRGIAVQWVPLGEGVIDFNAFIARLRQLATGVYIYIKPITGRPPALLPVYDGAFWKQYPDARAAEFARFLALAKKGRPYESHMVIEDLPGRQTPEAFVPAIQFQQREHMERSVEYAKKALDLGVRWRA
jgi:sugar phosphate isomerase/epimerase